jgi:hypothetical protein
MTPRRLEDLFEHVAQREDEQLDQVTPDAQLRQTLARHVDRRRGASARHLPRSTRWWWAAIAAALVPVSVLGLGWWMRAGEGSEPLRFSVGGRDGVLHAWESAPPAQRLSLDFSDGTRFSLAPEARARVVAVGPRGAEVVIESGHALAQVIPHSGLPAQWLVRTGPFEVEVKGTRFDVGWNPSTEEFSLRLFEGRVTISGCAFGTGLEVKANEQVRASCQRPRVDLRQLEAAAETEDVTALPPAPSAAPTPAELPSTAKSDAGSPASSTSAKPARSVAGAVRSARDVARSARGRWLELARQGRFGAAYELVSPVFDAECAEASLDEVLLLADTARHAGHADRARLAYLAVRHRAAQSAAGAAAAFELGRLCFDEDPEEASRWFETSLVERPRGPLAQAARDRLLEAAVRIGDVERVRRLAEIYLDETPEGPRAREAREILKRANSGHRHLDRARPDQK